MSYRRGTNILVVEDNPADSLLITGALKNSATGTRVAVATDGQQATDYLQRTGEYQDVPRPDLIILDLNLPRKDGKEVLNDIKTNPELRSIPVIVFTSSEAENDILNAYHCHANTYFSKPADLLEYFAILEEIKNYWLQQARLPPLSSELG